MGWFDIELAAEAFVDSEWARVQEEACGRTCGECENLDAEMLCPCGCGWAPCTLHGCMVSIEDAACEPESFRLRAEAV